MPSSTALGWRVLLAIGSVHALLALGLPFAVETGSLPSDNDEKLFGGTQVWSGWSLARASTNDGRIPVPSVMVIIVVASTIGLVLLACLALERPGVGLPAAAAGVGAALLISSIPIGNAVQGSFGDGHEGTSSWGLSVWRVALLLVVITGFGAALQTEQEQERNAAALRQS